LGGYDPHQQYWRKNYGFSSERSDELDVPQMVEHRSFETAPHLALQCAAIVVVGRAQRLMKIAHEVS